MTTALYTAKRLAIPVFTILLGLTASPLAMAQAPKEAPITSETKVVDGKVYTYVEQMPQLPGGGGGGAIVSAIQSRVVYPAEALKDKLEGRVFISFTVGVDGLVQDIKVVKGIGGGCDQSVLAAVQQLPQFIPGRQAGQPVPVRFTVPVTFQLKAPKHNANKN